LVEAFPDYLPIKPSTDPAFAPVFPVDELTPVGPEEVQSLRADLVGFYSLGSRLLVLDASGHYVLEEDCEGQSHSSGVFRPVRRGVVLEGSTGVVWPLARDGDTLVGTSGDHYSLFVAEKPRRADRRSDLGLLHRVDLQGDEP